MNNEIREILDELKEYASGGMSGLYPPECQVQQLLDYITNLQQAIKDTKDTADDMLYELKQENERLKENNQNMQEEMCRCWQQIDQLTNNWNELEEFIQKELDNNVDGIKSFGGYQCKIILDKMNEIKENNG